MREIGATALEFGRPSGGETSPSGGFESVARCNSLEHLYSLAAGWLGDGCSWLRERGGHL